MEKLSSFELRLHEFELDSVSALDASEPNTLPYSADILSNDATTTCGPFVSAPTITDWSIRKLETVTFFADSVLARQVTITSPVRRSAQSDCLCWRFCWDKKSSCVFSKSVSNRIS